MCSLSGMLCWNVFLSCSASAFYVFTCAKNVPEMATESLTSRVQRHLLLTKMHECRACVNMYQCVEFLLASVQIAQLHSRLLAVCSARTFPALPCFCASTYASASACSVEYQWTEIHWLLWFLNGHWRAEWFFVNRSPFHNANEPWYSKYRYHK